MAYVHPLNGDDLVKAWEMFNKAHRMYILLSALSRLRALKNQR